MAVFAVKSGKISQLEEKGPIDKDITNEEAVQKLCGKNLEKVLGVRLLDDQFGGSGSRADCVGLGEKYHPVIIEYKWWSSEEAVTQIINYAHKLRTTKKEEFEELVEKKLGTNAKEKVDWTKIRLVCVARRFKVADVLVAERFNQNLDGRGEGPYQIELVKYTAYENDKSSETLLEFEEVGQRRMEKEWDMALSLERYKDIVKEEDPEIFECFGKLTELIEGKDQLKKGVLEKHDELTFRRQEDNNEVFATAGMYMHEPREDGTRKVVIYAWFAPLSESVSSDNKEPASFLEEVKKHLDDLLTLERYKEIVENEDPELFNAFNDLVALIESNKDRIKKGELNIRRKKLNELIFYRQKDGEEFATAGMYMHEPREDGTRKVVIYAWFAPLSKWGKSVSSDNKEPAAFLEEVKKCLDDSLKKIGN